ncbi:MAG TPA: hypothetical protein VHE35_27035 [Kofleriaceae bacterium]|nr:hypothetical protein [Kofleriaceae bacterium]
MLDLAKPLGSEQGLTLYGDHDQDDLAYYLPDEITLAADGDRPELALQIYFPDEAVSAGDLAASVGALFSVGVTCGVSGARLEAATAAVRDRTGRPNLQLVAPPWEDGTIDLVLLDTSTGAASGAGTTGNTGNAGTTDPAMVSGIVGSRQPSLQDGRLSALFHARLDRRGAALVDDALRGGAGTVAGVLYDLKYAALRPALDMKITADLDEVADFVRASLGVSVYYVSADLAFVFDKMRQEGVIKVDVTSQLDTPEAQAAADQVVKDFQSTVMQQLFQPMVPPLGTLLGAATSTSPSSTSIVRLGATWGHSEHHRSIEVDYSKRQASRRSHNPQAHLHGLAAIASDPATFIHRVPLGDAWREMAVEIAAPGAFDDHTLRSVSAVLWRGRDRVLDAADAREDGLRLPADVVALAELGFSTEQHAPRSVAWVSDPSEVPGYHWQAQASWIDDDEIDSPPSLWSEPKLSRSQDLDLFPSLIFPTRMLHVELGEGLPPELALVELALVAHDDAGAELARRTLTLAPGGAAKRWGVRRASATPPVLDGATTFHFTDGRTLALPARRLVDRDLTILTPFATTRTIGLTVAGADASIDRIEVVARYQDDATGYLHEVVRVLSPPAFKADDLRIPVLHAADDVAWEAERIDRDGSRRRIAGGRTTRSVVIPAQGEARVVRVSWVGPATLADAELTRVIVRVRARADSGETTAPVETTYRATAEATPRVLSLDAGAGTLEFSVARRFLDGHEETTPFAPVEAGEVVVTP